MKKQKWHPLIRRSAEVLGIAVAYYAAGRLALLFAVPPGYATAVWPASGIALAGVLLLGYRVLPGIVLGSFLVNVWTSFDPTGASVILKSLMLAVGIGFGAALEAAAGAYLVRRCIGSRNPIADEKSIIKFLILGGPASCLLSASWGVTALWLVGIVKQDDYLFNVWTWWVGDAIGAMIFGPLIMTWFAGRRLVRLRRRIALSMLLCIMFSLTAILFFYTSKLEQSKINLDFEKRTDGMVRALKTNFDSHLEILYSVTSFFETASARVDRENYQAFVGRQISRHPGIQALSWCLRVSDAERDSFEQAARRDGYDGFQITERNAQKQIMPAERRDEYISIQFIEPHEGNERALGFNAASDPVRLEGLNQARDTGKPIATGRIKLVQETKDQFGFIVLLAAYRERLSGVGAEERRQNLIGVAVGVFRINDLVETALNGTDREGLEIKIFDDASLKSERLLYDSRFKAEPLRASAEDEKGESPAGLLRTVPFDAAGRRWELQFSLSSQYLAAHRNWQAWSVLATGLLFTGLLQSFLLVLMSRTSEIEELVTQRTAELQKANIELHNAILTKDRFLASMSHELRTPLNAVIGFTGTLLMKLGGPLTTDQEEQLNIIKSSAKRLLSIINEMLDLAKIGAGKLELSFEPVDCREAVQEAAATLRSAADAKKLKLETEFPEQEIALLTDRRALNQILINLTGNAIKFTDQGRVRIGLGERRVNGDTLVEISVTDTGIGIKPEDEIKLFRAFEQINAERYQEGKGLGLHLSRKLAELLGGRIEVESEYCKGSRFTLVIPKKVERN